MKVLIVFYVVAIELEAILENVIVLSKPMIQVQQYVLVIFIFFFILLRSLKLLK